MPATPLIGPHLCLEPDYIPIPSDMRQFFPPRGEYFTGVTDDGQEFTMVVAQAGSNAIHTPEDNSILGRHFRERMGLPSGAYVTREHLEAYGRLDVEFRRIDRRTYYMDFGPAPKKGAAD